MRGIFVLLNVNLKETLAPRSSQVHISCTASDLLAWANKICLLGCDQIRRRATWRGIHFHDYDIPNDAVFPTFGTQEKAPIFRMVVIQGIDLCSPGATIMAIIRETRVMHTYWWEAPLPRSVGGATINYSQKILTIINVA